VLKLEQFFFFFKVIDNLLQGFLEDKDLLFKDLDLLLLLEPPLLVLISSFLLNEDVSIFVFLVNIHFGLLPLVVVESIPLAHGLFCQLLVFIVDVPLYFLDISLSVLLSLQLEQMEAVLLLLLHLLLHPGLLNFNPILLFLDCFFQTRAILLPSHQL